MTDNDITRLKDLTANEAAEAKQAAYNAFLKEMAVGYRKPALDFSEFVSYPQWVRCIAKNQAAFTLSLLLIIALSLWVISSDKTYGVFHAGAVNHTFAYGIWAALVGVAAVLFVEGGLFYAGFAQMRNRINAEVRDGAEKDSHHTITVLGILWSIIFFSGLGLILQGVWDSLRLWRGKSIERSESDSNLAHLSSLLMAMAILTNVYGSIMPKIRKYEAEGISTSQQIEIALAGFLGVLTAVSLHIVGQQVALFVYGYYRDERRRQKALVENDWQNRVQERWIIEGEFREAQELDRRYRVKNGLPAGAKTPYLLPEGETVTTELPLSASKMSKSSVSFPVFLPPSNGKKEIIQ